MSFRHKAATAVLFLSAVASLQNANAETATANGFYIGAGIGPSRTSFNTNDSNSSTVYSDTNANSSKVTFSDVTDEARVKKFLLGYRFHRHYGIEVSLVDSDTYGFTQRTTLAQTQGDTWTTSSTRIVRENIVGFAIKHVGYFPLNDRLIGLASLGLLTTKNQISDVEPSTIVRSDQAGTISTRSEYRDGSHDEQTTAPFGGIGLQGRISKAFSVQIVVERYFKTLTDRSFQNTYIDSLSFELAYRL